MAITAGWFHACALFDDGGVKCWGHNGAGQLGDGQEVPIPDCVPGCNTDVLPGAAITIPQAVVGLDGGVTAVSGGGYHTCAVTATGGAVCWGYNYDGQLGDGTTPRDPDNSGGFEGPFVPTPVQVIGLESGVMAISAGKVITCALTNDGGAQCWGYGYAGQLGDGGTSITSTPVGVTGLDSGVTAIAAGSFISCAVKGGGVTCWPVNVAGLASGVAAVASGDAHNCALTAAGGVKCWGTNYDGELGNGTTSDSETPVDVEGLTGAIAIAAGGMHTCAVTSDGGVSCWGSNLYRQLGNGSADSSSTPVAVTGLSGVVAIAAGYDYTCALTDTAAIKCWGGNGFGQLGDGTTVDRSTPVTVLLSP